jgi:beta-lactamase regulating signal transducer with metallopeptidase domain
MSNMGILTVLAPAAIKAAVILGAAGVTTLSWRSASAATKHFIWTAAVSASLAVPLLSLVLSRFDAPKIEVAAWTPEPAPVVESPRVQEIVSAPAPAAQMKIETGLTAPVSLKPSEHSIVHEPLAQISSADRIASASSREPIDWSKTLPALWLTGFLIALIPLAIAVFRVRAFARTARPVRASRWRNLILNTGSISHLADSVEILESGKTAMPMTWGIVRPKLLVPSNTHNWAEWQCRDILLHELAHIERRDCLTQLIAQIACAIYWFNPLAWIAAARMKVERELACDDRVISAGSRASDYASNLLDVARTLRAPSLTSHTAIAMARPSQLSGRLLAVLDSRRNRRRVTRGIAAWTSFAAVALVLPLASLTIASRASADILPIPAASGHEAANVAHPPKSAGFITLPMMIVRAAQLPAISILRPSAFEPLTLAAKLSTAPLPALQSAQSESCWEGKDGSTNVSINSNGRNKSYTVRYSRDNCSLELRAEGDFTLRADLSDVETVSRDGWVRIEERAGRSSQRVEIRRAGSGSLEHAYWVNGDRSTFDANARAWLARTLLGVERRTAFAADTRVPQLYRSGGLRGVLSEIAQMSSAYPKSKYYSTLLDMGIRLDTNTLNEIVRQVSSDLSSSDYYMSEVLGKFGSQGSADETTWRLFAEAAGRMKSDYYKSETLRKVLSKGRLSSATVGTLLKSAAGMKSDYYLSDLLRNVAGKYALNAETRQYYVEALRGIESDYYRYELLRAMGNDGDWDAGTAGFVLEAAGSIKSDYYKSESLKTLVTAKHVENWPGFFSAASTIQSDYYKKETLTTAVRHAPLTREIVAGVINTASRMKSDSEMADVLSAVARSYRIDDSLRDDYEKAVDAMRSDYYRGAALSALRRSMART